MKFNHHELALYAATRQGRCDKEGSLWMKEVDSKAKKRQSYAHRWFLLCGNLLFYCRSEYPDSPAVGLIILERCQIEADCESGNRNTFKLVFEESEISYWFMANSAKDQDEWSTAISSGSYEYLRMAFSELRGQLMHLTGTDPLVENHPLGGLPIKNVSPVPASAPAFEGEPMFELSLACSSLVGNVKDGVPSSLIVTSCMTPPQAYWIRYAQTEVIEHNCDPRFFTTVVFYKGSVSMATQLKFEVFDVYDRRESQMCPIGQSHCRVQDLVQAPNQQQRLEILFDGSVCGYLTVHVMKSHGGTPMYDVGGGVQLTRPPSNNGAIASPTGESATDTAASIEVEGGFFFKTPMDNLVIKTFQFPISGSTDEYLKVTEVMGEGQYSFSLPMQILDMYISEEQELLSQYNSLTGLVTDWEIVRQDVMLEHKQLMHNYQESKTGLQAKLEAGIKFKKSTSKSEGELDFVPVNLHIQQMKVTSRETDNKDKVVYTAVTAGCPTAFRLKYKNGGLAKMQVCSPLANMGNFSPSPENKAFRAKTLLGRMENVRSSVQTEAERLHQAIETANFEEMSKASRTISDRIHQLSGHCNINLVNDSLRHWLMALKEAGSCDLNAGSLCHRLEEHVLSMEAHVDGAVTNLLQHADYAQKIESCLNSLLNALDEVVDIFKKALYFLLVRESHRLIAERIPIGDGSYKHRRDIVFSQAVTTLITCVVFKLLQSLVNKLFVAQLVEVGFLCHWESLLSTMGGEIGMLEDFIVAIHDLNNLKLKVTLAESLNDIPKITGSRYRVCVEIPIQRTLFRVLPATLQDGKEVNVFVVLFTQGINEQQSLADRFGDSTLQDQINMRSLQQLTTYFTRFKDRFGTASSALTKKCQKATQLLEQLRAQVHTKKDKNVDILSLSQELCRNLEGGRVISCKSAKDRTAMSVTLEQAHILTREMNMDSSCFQQAIDTMRSQGTRLRNAEKNVGQPMYAFNVVQVFTLPQQYRPPDGTYKKLQT